MEELSLNSYIAILHRWKKVFLGAGFILFALSIIFVLNWSNYRSTATIEIEQPEVSANATSLSETNSGSTADRRISIIRQKVLSTSSLVEVITKFNLYASERKDFPIADIAEKMRENIRLDLIGNTKTGRGQISTIAFTLSFDYREPLIAQQVTDELVTRFLNQDLKERRTEAQQTSSFLGAQIEALEKSLSEQETSIAEYQKKHGINRPENLAFNQQYTASLTLNLQSLDSQITTAQGNLTSLRTQFLSADPYIRASADGQSLTTPSIQLKALQTQYSTLTAQYGPEHPDVLKVRNQIAALKSQVNRTTNKNGQLKAQIIDTRTNLEVAQKTYTPEHPNVVALQNQLKKLEDQLASQEKDSPDSVDEGIVPDADNPAYLQLAAQLHTAEEQYKGLLNQRKELQEQLEGYQKALIENPQAQKEMAALTRDYENSQNRYRELKERKMIADMNEQMEKDRIGERLSLINPPELPIDTQPRRLFLILGSIFFSFFGGLASIVTAQIISQSVIGIDHLETITGTAPLVSIPHIYTQEEIRYSLRRRLWRGSITSWNVFTGRIIPQSRKHLAPYFKRLAPYYERLTPYSEKLVPYYKKTAPYFERLASYAKRITTFCKRFTKA